jgi:hypothetical protein
MKRSLIQLFIISIGVSSCASYAYYQSPLHTNTSTYKAIPLERDSIRSAIYASASISAGGANDKLRDGNASFNLSVHRSHNLGNFQALYGISGAAGSYNVDSVYNFGGFFGAPNQFVDPESINPHVGRKFYGTVGGFGAANLVFPTEWGEWRILGAEAAWSREYGSYLRFRKALPDSSANLIERRSDLLTLALSTDFVFKTHNGSIGMKFLMGRSLRNIRLYLPDGTPSVASPGWLSGTIHWQQRRYSAYSQLNAGFHAFSFLIGGSYRLEL